VQYHDIVCVDVGDIECLRSDRFSAIVVKPNNEVSCASQLDDRSLWNSDNADDPSLFIEQR